ncbi:Mur ligase family protein [Rhodanobacter sp. AS-Z3]|uniref:Mur ligase family protein n=1 Tax=Rhodanobacter sp. AS-Z3 TaxID=3031330 RepID=UPI00247929B4|nr:Mur ligase family protein [Rhodanobacter sp. AS-Z3]WEN16195.1 Mur ligase family protein [Rhodanobacter sp. AS-Z3]
MPDFTPFEDSRRLTGANLYFSEVGAVLETQGELPDEAALQAWGAAINKACHALGWPASAPVVRQHASGASLALIAPPDQLFSATEVNEWAWCCAYEMQHGPLAARWYAPGFAAVWDEPAAMATLRAFAAAERQPGLLPLVQAAELRGLPVLIDDEWLSIGAGDGAACWPIAQLPPPDMLDWASLHAVPTALVTGSNGKTTTVRLLSAMAQAYGWRTGHSCTDGVFVDGEAIEAGDYSGPAGARAVMRTSGVQAAILETARGGLLRRGLAVQHAQVAVVTNVSDDHFGEYGIHDLSALAAVKLTVASVIDASGLLVLNADDKTLLAQPARFSCPIGWFAQDDAHPQLQATRERGGATCGVREGHLWLSWLGQQHDLGDVDRMPLSFAGRARYNIANLAAAALAAAALGIAADTIAATLQRFGHERADNPGRLQHWQFGALRVFVDYAHNPEGLHGLLEVGTGQLAAGRLGLLLGQAGNREEPAIRELAAVAAGFHPARVMLKDIEGYMRGRVAGEVAAILRDQLQRGGVSGEAIVERLDEVAAVRELLAWAQADDVLVLPVHGVVARQQISALLDALQGRQWRAGVALPTL